MKTFLTILGVLVLLVVLVVVLAIVFTPWMNRWHTSAEERAAAFPGDDLVENPKLLINRAVTIKAGPEKITPWLLQIGADKAGMYSYTALERLTGCQMAKDEVIRAEWQTLRRRPDEDVCRRLPRPLTSWRVPSPTKRSSLVTRTATCGRRPGSSCSCRRQMAVRAW